MSRFIMERNERGRSQDEEIPDKGSKALMAATHTVQDGLNRYHALEFVEAVPATTKNIS
jgi:hypothetical protein